MIVFDRCVPPALPTELATAIRLDVHGALAAVATNSGKCIVNDARWLAIRENGSATLAVMNSAKFFSNTFQEKLRQSKGHPWETNYSLEEQEIDAYNEFTLTFEGFYLEDNGLRSVVDHFWDHPEDFCLLVQANWPHVDQPSLDQMVWWLTQMYYRRKIHDLSIFPGRLHKHFSSTGQQKHVVRVAIEFETGYTASAYRAFVKLNSLYALGVIDIGLFVATDKKNAHRIWPESNRNVHYDELSNRHYRRNVYFPIWEVMFAPDSYSTSASYLSPGGTLYLPSATTDTFVHAGTERQIFESFGRRTFRE